MNPTPSQKLAIDLKGDSLLVSAAAGAGKTSVLTARVLRILSDEQNVCDADRLMILTFTKAAAAEMRERITEALMEAVQNDKENAHLRRQLMLLPCSKICTIDSACLDIVHQNFSLLGIDPQFDIMSTDKDEILRSEYTEAFTEELYERAKTEQNAFLVIDWFSEGKSDGKLKTALFEGAKYLLREPWPSEYISRVCTPPSDNVFEDIDGLHTLITEELSDIYDQYTTILSSAEDIGYDALYELYAYECLSVGKTLSAVRLSDLRAASDVALSTVFERHPTYKDGYDEILWRDCQELRSELKERFLKLREKFIYADNDTMIRDRKMTLPVLRAYLELCNELNAGLFEKRRDMRSFTFDDIERLALTLLVKDSAGTPTEYARELSKQYDEIIVDEYQDCNRLQDSIFTALSKDGKNIFTVGDVKQSIYGFRGAEPSLFIEKQNMSVLASGDILTRPSRLNLCENFRSHPCILDFVNAVFDPLMTKSHGGIDYAAEHRLETGGLYGDSTDAGVEVSFVVPDGKPDKRSITELEATFVAKRIKAIIGNETVYDVKAKKSRTVRPDDIVILMNAPKTSGKYFEKALEAQGVGCINNNPSEQYLDTPEVRDLLAYLQVIDNPYNDIPLVTLMYSDYFGFTANELGALRAENKRALFYDAVREYAKKDAKTHAFIERIESLRILSQTTDVYGIISAIYESSGILIRLANRDGGASARANLLMLAEFANNFEASQYKGLFTFINYIVKLMEKETRLPPAKLRKSDGCVNIMSIHGSKGLEYPVVFLVCTGDSISAKGGTTVTLTPYGAGTSVNDTENYRYFSSVYRNMLIEKQKEEDYAERMRLLYVALTRARARLYITAGFTHENFKKQVRDAVRADGFPTMSNIKSSPTFIKWMLYSLVKTKPAKKILSFAELDGKPCGDLNFDVKIEIASADDAQDVSVPEKSGSTFDAEYVKKQISRRYEYEADTLVPAKLSVSDIKSMKSDKSAVKKPRFMSGGITGSDRGNATHAFLQYCDFEKVHDKRDLENEIDRLVLDEFITKTDADLVDREKVLDFLLSSKMQALLKSDICSKEERLIFTLPANEILDTESTEPVTIQGIIDCLYITDGYATILDYKTDRVSDKQTLIDRYAVQLDLYEKALFITKGIKTDKKYIYSFALGEFIEL